MAKAMTDRIKRIRPNGPCAIAAYSSGGILAFEMTKQLINSGYPVSFLGLIDTCTAIEKPLPLSETDAFLEFLCHKYAVLETLKDSMAGTRLRKLTVNKAIEEIRSANLEY